MRFFSGIVQIDWEELERKEMRVEFFSKQMDVKVTSLNVLKILQQFFLIFFEDFLGFSAEGLVF